MSYKQKLENAVSARNFRINDCLGLGDALNIESKRAFDRIQSVVGSAAAKYIHDSLVRNSFLIELVNRDITSTKFQVRWTEELNESDPRFASYEECLRIAQKLIDEMNDLSKDDLLLLSRFKDYKSVPYELPFDYTDRYAKRIHSESNIELVFQEAARRAIGLRIFLSDESNNPDAGVFKTILADKIKVKTYLTDRAQTGLYQTNREKRWETHPLSVQFALRSDCMEIESKLLLQVAKFKGANSELVKSLQREGYLPDEFDCEKCPITGEYLEYGAFVGDVLNPKHGRSPFQVGHLNPLKTVSDGDSFGHTASNISWISDDGNRIQGSLSMKEVDELLVRIYVNRDFSAKVVKYLGECSQGN